MIVHFLDNLIQLFVSTGGNNILCITGARTRNRKTKKTCVCVEDIRQERTETSKKVGDDSRRIIRGESKYKLLIS